MFGFSSLTVSLIMNKSAVGNTQSAGPLAAAAVCTPPRQD